MVTRVVLAHNSLYVDQPALISLPKMAKQCYLMAVLPCVRGRTNAFTAELTSPPRSPNRTVDLAPKAPISSSHNGSSSRYDKAHLIHSQTFLLFSCFFFIFVSSLCSVYKLKSSETEIDNIYALLSMFSEIAVIIVSFNFVLLDFFRL
eukprot:scpid59584/ scgid19065/ 